MADNQNNNNNSSGEISKDNIQSAVTQSTFDRIQDLKARRDKIVEEITAKNGTLGKDLGKLKGKDKTSKDDIKAVKSGLRSDAANDADIKALLEELLKIIEEIKELVRKHFHENLGSLTSALGWNKNKAFGELNSTIKQLAQNIDENSAIQAYTMEQVLGKLRDVKVSNGNLAEIKDGVLKMAQAAEAAKETKLFENKNFYGCLYDKLARLGDKAFSDIDKVIGLLNPDNKDLDSLDIKTRKLIETYSAFKANKTIENYKELRQALISIKDESKSETITRTVNTALDSMDKAHEALWNAEMYANEKVAVAQKKVDINLKKVEDFEVSIADCEKQIETIKAQIIDLKKKITHEDSEYHKTPNISIQQKLERLNKDLKREEENHKTASENLERTKKSYEDAIRELANAKNSLRQAQETVETFKKGKTPDTFYHDFTVKSQLISYGKENEYLIAYRGQLIKANIEKDDTSGEYKIHLADSEHNYSDFIQGGRLNEDKASHGYFLIKEENKNTAEYLLSKVASMNGKPYQPSRDVLDKIYEMAGGSNSVAAEYLSRCFNEPQLSPDGKFNTVARVNDNGDIEYIVRDLNTKQKLSVSLTSDETGKSQININSISEDSTVSNFGKWYRENDGLSVKYSMTSQNEAAMYMLKLPVVQDFLETLGIPKENQNRSLVSQIPAPFEKVEDNNLDKVQKIFEHMKKEANRTNKDVSIQLNNLENSTTIDIVKGKMLFSIAFDKEGNPFTTHFNYDYQDNSKSHTPILLSHRGIGNNSGSLYEMKELLKNNDVKDVYNLIGHCLQDENIVAQYKSQEAIRSISQRVENAHWDMDTINKTAAYKEADLLFEKSITDRGIGDITQEEKNLAHNLMKGIEVIKEIEINKDLSRLSKEQQDLRIGRAIIEANYGANIAQADVAAREKLRADLQNALDDEARCIQVARGYKQTLSEIGLYNNSANKLINNVKETVINYAADISFRNQHKTDSISANILGYLADEYSNSFGVDLSQDIAVKVQQQYDTAYDAAEQARQPLRIVESWNEQFAFEKFNGIEGQDKNVFRNRFERAIDKAMSQESISMDEIRKMTDTEGQAYQIAKMLQQANVIVSAPIGQYESNAVYKTNTAKFAEYEQTKNQIKQELKETVKSTKKQEQQSVGLD